MNFESFDEHDYLKAVWNAIEIRRSIPYSLFTFGDSELKYFLVLRNDQPGEPIKIRQGEIKITRPTIITAHNARPELLDFFESSENESLMSYLMTRSAAFSNLRLSNTVGNERIVSDEVEEVVDKLTIQLDDEEEDRVGILVAPEPLAGVALIRFAAERIIASAPDNVNELRERGFLN